MEYLSLQGSPDSKLILHHLLRNIPAQEQTGEKTCRRKEQLSRYEVEPIEQSLAAERQFIRAPKESEQNAPMMAQATVTIMAPFFLSIFNSS